MAELRNNSVVRLQAYDYLGEEKGDFFARNGQGLTLAGLVKGQTYTIRVTQHSGSSPYQLIITKQ
jgi:hypothetical protein